MVAEPQIGLRTRAAILALIGQCGFVIDEDAGADEQAARVGGRPSTFAVAKVSRIAVVRPPGAERASG